MRHGELLELVPSLIEIARNAGRAILEIYRQRDIGLRCKVDDSPVTAADLAAHHRIIEGLRQLTPDCPVVSEEDPASLAFRSPTGRFWLIDPLDGTKEFIAGKDEFTVNIALIENGRSCLGVVYAPALDSLYWGGSGLGTWRIDSAGVVTLRVAQTEPGAICRVLASQSHLNEATSAFIDLLGEVQIVRAGSSLKFCRIAEGDADIYPRLAPTCEWDTAAAQAVLEGAGGGVVDFAHQALHYGKIDVVNPSFIAATSLSLIPS